ncbi:MAG: hypothetical protein IJS53_02115 [Clostridia bacterium]|nr:hypothetical protein [Clostridia bacterium]
MKKWMALLLAIVMLFSVFGTAAFAEGEASDGGQSDGMQSDGGQSEGGESEGEQTPEPTEVSPGGRFQNYDQVNELITIIPAEGDQVELGYLKGVTEILEVDGLKFKDLNSNGKLDVYEDWRQDTAARVKDLYEQLTLEEKGGMFFHTNVCGSTALVEFSNPRYMFEPNGSAVGGGQSMWYYINVLKVTSHLDNTNGTPAQQTMYHNAMQALGEDTRLGIPIVVSNDRQYNAWGGIIDTPHDAFGAANDLELSRKLWTQYSLESRAIGIHVVLHPYGQELGSWNGEDPEYAGTMTREETFAIQVEGGTEACMKHFIARGGDSSFQDARSEAQTVNNWMTAWRIAFEANPKWVMMNGYGTGLSNSTSVIYDEATMTYLRDTLGYDGVVVSDWGDTGDNFAQGIAVDGTEIMSLSIPERYAFAINLGLDQIGIPATDYGVDGHSGPASRAAIDEALATGLISEERCWDTCRRVLSDKFDLGLFENPYCDVDKALALACSAEYIAEPWDIVDNETLSAARNPEVVALERQLEAESTILFKNDDNLLPLEKGIKVYFGSTASQMTQEGYRKVLPEFCELVENVEDADVVIADCTQWNDAAELIADDAKEAGKKLVILANCIDPDTSMLTIADAVLGLTFDRTPDHGSKAGDFILTIEPIVLAQLLFGDAEPAGMVVKELPRTSLDDDAQWKDLAGDQGVDMYVRLLLLGIMEHSENNTVPSNFSDALVQFRYGMRYGAEPEFTYRALVLPKLQKEVTTEGSSGASTSIQTVTEAKAGEPFTIYFMMENLGDDGIINLQALVDGEVNAEKLMAIHSGDWRVVTMELTIDQPGEHTITVGTLSGTLNLAE